MPRIGAKKLSKKGKNDLTLSTSGQIRRAHFAENNSTVLYWQVRKGQGPNETSLDFVIRMLDLYLQVLFASEHAQSGLKYSITKS